MRGSEEDSRTRPSYAASGDRERRRGRPAGCAVGPVVRRVPLASGTREDPLGELKATRGGEYRRPFPELNHIAFLPLETGGWW